MGLREAIGAAVGAGFNAIGNIAEACTHRRVSSAYTPSTGTNVVTNTDYSITKCVFTKYSSFEIDKNLILGTDIKMIAPTALVLTTPNIATDQIIRSNGQIYNILRVYYDPAKAATILQLRSPS